jgi:hypothetical protein
MGEGPERVIDVTDLGEREEHYCSRSVPPPTATAYARRKGRTTRDPK